jgi:hypothetical protein
MGLYYPSTGPWACGTGPVSRGRLGVVERSAIGFQLAVSMLVTPGQVVTYDTFVGIAITTNQHMTMMYQAI